MAAVDFHVDVYGFKDLQESFGTKAVTRKIAATIGMRYIRRIHNAISDFVSSEYNIPGDLFDSLARADFLNPTIKGNVIESALVYRYKSINLAEYPYFWYWGNIEPIEGKKRKGRVHETSIRRATSKIVYGRHGFGGFTVKGYMVERKTEEKYPIVGVYGPSMAQLASYGFTYSPEVPRIVEELENYIIESI